MTKSTYQIEIKPGVTIEIPKKLNKLQLMVRRIHQLFLIMFSDRFSPKRNVSKDTAERYAQEKEIRYYKEMAKAGLYPLEKDAVTLAISLLKETKKETKSEKLDALVLGCGTGREAFALESEGLKVTGFDFCSPMIEVAKELKSQKGSHVAFVSKPPQKKYDIVLFTYALTNHETTYSKRIDIIKEWIPYLNQEGVIIFSGYFQKIKFLDRFFWAHIILRFRWLFKKECRWGTTAISHLGWHNDESTPLPFYLYQKPEDIKNELKAAGLNVTEVETTGDHPMKTYPDIFLAKP